MQRRHELLQSAVAQDDHCGDGFGPGGEYGRWEKGTVGIDLGTVHEGTEMLQFQQIHIKTP